MDQELTALWANGLATAAILAALVQRLIEQRVISAQDGREIYEQALLMLEGAQGASSASFDAFVVARELIEQHLRRPAPPSQT